MGLFKKVFGTGDTTLELRVDEDWVPAGGDVVLRWEVGGELDEKVRAIRAGVTATAYWLHKDVDRDADGSRDVDVERREAEAWSEAHDFEAQLGSGTTTITLPADAPPGSKDVLKWTAWVAIDRERGRDHDEEVTLYVRRPATDAAPVECSGDGIVLTGIPDHLRLGKRYTGTATVTPSDDVTGTLRLFLVRRVRHVSRDGASLGDLAAILDMPKLPGTDLFQRAGFAESDVIVHQEEALELDLSGGKQEFAAGRPAEFGVDFEAPGRGPTTAHDHAQVDWRIVVKLDRRMRGDLRAAMPVELS